MYNAYVVFHSMCHKCRDFLTVSFENSEKWARYFYQSFRSWIVVLQRHSCQWSWLSFTILSHLWNGGRSLCTSNKYKFKNTIKEKIVSWIAVWLLRVYIVVLWKKTLCCLARIIYVYFSLSTFSRTLFFIALLKKALAYVYLV